MQSPLKIQWKSVKIFKGPSERSYVMIKPDGVQRGLVGEIISRFEKKGFTLIGLKLYTCSTELAKEHYKDLSSKPFFPKLVEYITSGPVVCLALKGPGVVASARKLIGATNPLQAEPGTIRGMLCMEVIALKMVSVRLRCGSRKMKYVNGSRL
ncbi:hypothetical protein KP509_02G021300 [Ceratopteris richardii]|uniref:Nucleoside diphosphate kinase n=1 Tax=Ceratopteris richardii TaxID=49495 RepID=A0A8T2V3S3_CERRI|nr:hypothetical protein KP509_02G021300 [Ceratopteris richardii]